MTFYALNLLRGSGTPGSVTAWRTSGVTESRWLFGLPHKHLRNLGISEENLQDLEWKFHLAALSVTVHVVAVYSFTFPGMLSFLAGAHLQNRFN